MLNKLKNILIKYISNMDKKNKIDKSRADYFISDPDEISFLVKSSQIIIYIQL